MNSAKPFFECVISSNTLIIKVGVVNRNLQNRRNSLVCYHFLGMIDIVNV